MMSSNEEFIQVSFQGDDVYIKISRPGPGGKMPAYSQVTEFIRSNNFVDVDYDALKSAYKKPGGDPVMFAKRETGLGITSRFVIEVSKDRMTCYVTLLPPREQESMIYPYVIVKEIKDKGIKCEITEIDIKAAIDNKVFRKKFVVAKGTELVIGKDGRLEMVAPASTPLAEQMPQFASSSVFETFEIIRPVKTGDVAARVLPPGSGIDGIDVYGNVVKSIDGDPVEFAGGNIEISNDRVVANINGCAVRTETGIDIEPLLLVKNAVNREIKHDGSIKIMGDAENCSLIEATGDIEIHGIAVNSGLRAGRNIFIHENLQSKAEITVMAGRDLLCKNIFTTTIIAENVFVLSTIFNSTISALRTVRTLEKTGKISGGRINSGFSVKTGTIGDGKGNDIFVNVATPKIMSLFRNKLVDYFKNKIDSINKNKIFIALKLDKLKERMNKPFDADPEAYKKLADSVKLDLDKCDQKINDLYKEIVQAKDPKLAVTSGEIMADVFYPGTVIAMGNSSRKITEPKSRIRYSVKHSNIFMEGHNGI